MNNDSYDPSAAIISFLLTNKKSRKPILQQTCVEDFTSEYSVMYETLRNAIEDNSIDNHDFRSGFTIAHVSTLQKRGTGNYKQALKDFIDRSARRRIKSKLLIAQMLIDDSTVPIADIRNEIGEMKNISDDSRFYNKKLVTMNDILGETLDRMQKIQSGQIKHTPWGIQLLDQYAPAEAGDFNVIAARPGIGKSIIAHNCIMGAMQRTTVGYFCAEMRGDMIGMRCLSQNSGVGLKGMRQQGGLTHADMQSIMQSFDRIRSHGDKCFISTGENEKGDTVEDICRWIKRIYEYHGVENVFIDYLQRIKPTNSKLSRRDQVQHMCSELKNTAMNLGIVVTTLAQLNRTAAGERPAVHHLAECGYIEQEASIIILGDRLEAGEDAKSRKYKGKVGLQGTLIDLTSDHLQNTFILNIAKNRNNPKRIVYAHADMDTLSIGDEKVFSGGNFGSYQ